MISILLLLALAGRAAAHGYISTPPARQYMCMVDGGFWWPTDGSAIPDPACRSAYQYVAARSGTDAAQSMFVQHTEYAALAGNHQSLDDIKQLVAYSLCSANATGYTSFGDKSGVSIPANWRATKIAQDLTIEFCATAEHYGSFHIFITRDGFDSTTEQLTWDDLIAVQSFVTPAATATSDPKCSSSTSYKLPTHLPYRSTGIILVWWQRDDPVGEGFYNCADITM